MTVAVSNTNLNDSFNTWRLNTNLAATTLSNNVVTVSRAGSANRGGAAKGNGHVSGTFSATQLRATTLKGGNTTADSTLTIASNTTIQATTLTVAANTTFTGNVDFSTAGTDRLNLGTISRIIIGGGAAGQFIRSSAATDNPEYKSLTLRDITDLSSNAANIILSGANSSFTAQGGQPAIVFSNGTDYAYLHLASSVTAGDSDVHLKLSDTNGSSRFAIADSANVVVVHITSDGDATFSANVITAGIRSSGNILPASDDAIDLGSTTREFRNLYIDGVANIDELSMGTATGQGVSTSLIPKTDAAGNLGSATRKWGTAWADTTNGGAGVFNTMGISGTLNANGATTLAGTTVTTLNATSAVDLDTTLNVDGNSTLNGVTVTTLTANGAATFNGNMTLGDAQTDTITVKGKFANQSTTGTASFNGDVNLGQATADTIKVKGYVGSDVIPKTGEQHDLGTTVNRWHNIYANTAFANTLSVDNNATIAGDLTVQGATSLASGQTFTSPIGRFANVTTTDTLSSEGDTDIGTDTSDTVTINALVDSSVLPSGATRDLGGTSNKWRNIYASGSLFIDTNADIDGKITNDGVTVISSNGKLHANNAVTSGTITTTMLANTMTSGGNFGSATQVPVFQVNDKGQVTGITEVSVAGVSNIDYTQSNNTITVTTQAGTIFKAPIDAATTTATTGRGLASFNSSDFTVSSGHVSYVDTTVRSVGSDSGTATPSVHTFNIYGGEGIDTSGSGANITIAGENASTSNKGIASFDSGDFSVSSGAVSLKNATTGAVLTINGTSNEVNVSRSNGTVTVGLPDDVTIAGQLNVGENVVVSGNLFVSGTTTTVNSETVNIADNIIVLNSNHTGSPTQDAGISIERGTSADKTLIWDESNDRWTVGSETFVAGTFIGALTGNSSTATKLATSRSIGISLSGDVAGSGSANFDGSGNITISATNMTVQPNSVELGTDTTGNYVAGVSAGTDISVSGSGSESATVTINHADTSTLDGAYGSTDDGTKIDTITVDARGHVTAVSTGPTMDQWILEDGDGTEVTITNDKEVKFVEGGGINIDWTDTSTGSDGDPYDLTFTINTGITAGSGLNGGGTLNATRTINLDSDVRGDMWIMGRDTNDYYSVGTTTHNWYLDGAEDMRLSNNGNLDVEGDIIAFSTSISSDERLKTDITKIDNSLEILDSINGVNFTWKKNDRKSTGVIAQDVEKVMPHLVNETEKLGTDGVYKTVNYDGLVGVLIEAVKELSARVKELESK